MVWVARAAIALMADFTQLGVESFTNQPGISVSRTLYGLSGDRHVFVLGRSRYIHFLIYGLDLLP